MQSAQRSEQADSSVNRWVTSTQSPGPRADGPAMSFPRLLDKLPSSGLSDQWGPPDSRLPMVACSGLDAGVPALVPREDSQVKADTLGEGDLLPEGGRAGRALPAPSQRRPLSNVHARWRCGGNHSDSRHGQPRGHSLASYKEKLN